MLSRAIVFIVFCAMVFTGCFSPKFRDDLACDSSGGCPPDTTCGADNICHAPGTAIAVDAPVDDVPRVDAAVAICGNGIPEPGEGCDDGNTMDGDDCLHNCQIPGACGNGVLDPGEQCDDSNDDDHDDCVSCKAAYCGDGKINNEPVNGHAALEMCDDGAQNGKDGSCTLSCGFSTCGDGLLDPVRGEECDNGLANGPGKSCTASCKRNICGDGDVLAGQEECDDGNTNDGDMCEANCTKARCGNHITDPGEQCDDGNVINGDGCENNCTAAACGNAIVDRNEVCDDGNASACGSCSATCMVVTSAPATGLLFVGSGSDLGSAPASGNNRFSLVDDSLDSGASVVFEYTNGSVAAGRIAISFTAADTAPVVALLTANAINGSKLLITATAVNSVVVLVNQRASARGNSAITVIAGSSTFSSSPMSGGQGGDCGNGIGCVDDLDCGGSNCNNGSCAICTQHSDCNSHLCDASGVCRRCRHNIDCGAGATCTAEHECIGN